MRSFCYGAQKKVVKKRGRLERAKGAFSLNLERHFESMKTSFSNEVVFRHGAMRDTARRKRLRTKRSKRSAQEINIINLDDEKVVYQPVKRSRVEHRKYRIR